MLRKIDGRCPYFLISYLAGIIFYAVLLYWLTLVTWVGYIFLVLYLALYLGFFGLGVQLAFSRSPLFSGLFLPSLWVVLEFIRSHLFTGFGWGLLGYSQYRNLPFIQIADCTGAYGISFLIVLVSVCLIEIIRRFKNLKSVLPLIYLTAGVFMASMIYGNFRLNSLNGISKITPHLKIAVIQGNIPQNQKWDAHLVDTILSKYIRLSRDAALKNPDVIIWPETSFPGTLGEDKNISERVFSLAKELKASFLIGSQRPVEPGSDEMFNSAFLISEQGKIMQVYDKLHLVPFGEYVPLPDVLGWIGTATGVSGFLHGNERTVFRIKDMRFSVLICFEDVFPGLVRDFRKEGAEFLVNITNDAWFGKTSAPYQHLQASVFRAIENRVCVIRSANTGISGFITPAGEIKDVVRDKNRNITFVEGYSVSGINAGFPPSIYSRYGDWFVWVCLILVCIILGKDFMNKLF
ncbi:MAG: apolipoprotein N-acyltransferase [Candidatus Omnitrophica bacterium]|nr:apolipoprotein N-acyltransferase [Candidatus Omnitrophota bacterium]